MDKIYNIVGELYIAYKELEDNYKRLETENGRLIEELQRQSRPESQEPASFFGDLGQELP